MEIPYRHGTLPRYGHLGKLYGALVPYLLQFDIGLSALQSIWGLQTAY